MYVKNTTFHKLQKHPDYEDNSDPRRKVVKVKGTFIRNSMFRTFFDICRHNIIIIITSIILRHSSFKI